MKLSYSSCVMDPRDLFATSSTPATLQLLTWIVLTIGTVLQAPLNHTWTNRAVLVGEIEPAVVVIWKAAVASDLLRRNIEPKIFRPTRCHSDLIGVILVVFPECQTQVALEPTASNYFGHRTPPQMLEPDIGNKVLLPLPLSKQISTPLVQAFGS